MEKPGSWRARLVAFGGVLAVTAAMFTAGGTSAEAASSITQGSSTSPVNNYAGPNCPGAGWNCANPAAGVSVVQKSGGGQNVYEAQGFGGTVTQTNTTGTNSASCNLSTTDQESTQTCVLTQSSTSGNNTINANISAAPVAGTNGFPVNLSTVTQSAAQRLVTSQTTTTTGNNALSGTLTINEQSNSLVDASTPVNHTQDSFHFAGVKQNANGTGNNSASLTLKRSLLSSARGGKPTQLQDTKAVPSVADIDTSACENYALANGNACIYQRANGSSATNTLTLRANDKKSIDATNLNPADQTSVQQQGRDGQTEWLGLDDVQSPNNLLGTTVNFGTSGGDENSPTGLTKTWSMTSTGVFGGELTAGSHAQYDEMQIPSIGLLSPGYMTSEERSVLTAPTGAKQIIALFAKGHADGNWTGQLDATMTAGTKSQTATYPFSGQDIDASLYCAQNTDVSCAHNIQSGGFAIGLGSMNDPTVYWWGSQWSATNKMADGAYSAPSSFKGFENSTADPTCGGTWTTTTGNSPPPAIDVPTGTVMAVIVTGKVTMQGSTKISGDIKHIVAVKTNPGYSPDPSTPGTGTVVGTIC